MRNIRTWLIAVVTLLCSGMMSASDFKVGNFSYSILSATQKTVSVSEGTSGWIPEKVTYNGSEYTVAEIGRYAFSETSISYFYLPETIKAIRENAFGFTAMESIIIPNSVEIIEGGAFWCSDVKKIIVGKGVKTIGHGAFYKCENLDLLIFLSSVPPSHDSRNYKIGNNNTELIVPRKSNYIGTELDRVFYGNIIEPITFENNEFTYTGMIPSLTYVRNIESSKDIKLKESAVGIYEQTFSVYSSSIGITMDIPYTYTINKAPLTINVNDAEKVYGDENPQFTYSLNGFVNNEDESVLSSAVTFSTTANKKSAVGTYSVAASATAQNYEISCTEGTLTVKKAPVTVVVNAKSRVYGDANPQFDFTYVGLKNGDGMPVFTSELNTSTKATKYSDVGDYEVTVSGGMATNYSFTEYIPGTLTVTQAPLGISAQSTVREYGEANPEFQFAYSGFKNEDTEECLTSLPTVVTSATPTSSVGEYEITPNGAEAKNYAISYTSGTLTVNKAPLTVQAEAAERVYGEENPKFTFTYSGFKNEETEEVFTNRPSATTEAGLTSAVGTYDIVPSGAEAQNYDITYKNGTLSVTKAPLAVGVVDNKREYGEENPAIALTYSGFKNSDNENCIAEKPAVTVNAEKKSDVGEYTISVAGGLAQNYMFTEYNEGKLTIEKAPLTVIAENKERLYFEANPEFTYRCEGFKNDDTKSVITTQPNFECSATQTSGAGEYEITLSGAEAKNYELSYQGAKLTVGKRTIDVKVGDCTRVYNEDNPEFAVSYSGFVNNESEKVFTAMPTLYCSADKTTDVGSYEITASGAEAANYDFNYKSGTLTIEKATQEIVWEQDLSEVALGDQVELTATATSGLVIEYQLADNNFVSIYEANGKVYLDCSGVGQVVIKAIQNGNKNYHAAIRVSKILVVTFPSEIENATINDSDAPIYSLKGERMACSRKELQKGIYIQNGKKFVVK